MAVEHAQPEPIDDDADAPAATKVPPKPKKKDPPPKQLPPYRVLLHNDEVNTFEWVIDSIVALTPLNLHDAVDKTFEAHDVGVSLLLVTHLERAELYRDQFATKKLKVTIEPAE